MVLQNEVDVFSECIEFGSGNIDTINQYTALMSFHDSEESEKESWLSTASPSYYPYLFPSLDVDVDSLEYISILYFVSRIHVPELYIAFWTHILVFLLQIVFGPVVQQLLIATLRNHLGELLTLRQALQLHQKLDNAGIAPFEVFFKAQQINEEKNFKPTEGF